MTCYGEFWLFFVLLSLLVCMAIVPWVIIFTDIRGKRK